MFTKTTRAIAAAAVASIALSTVALAPASAAPLATEVGYRNDGGAAAIGAFAAIAGTIAMIAAAHHDRGPYYGGPYGYGYAPAPDAYVPRYGSDGGGWHRHWHGR
jgi:hypothetical protein